MKKIENFQHISAAYNKKKDIADKQNLLIKIEIDPLGSIYPALSKFSGINLTIEKINSSYKPLAKAV